MKASDLYKRYYLEDPTWIDGTTQFKKMIQEYLVKDAQVLDVGAGGKSCHNYKGVVAKVVGIDLSEEVFKNPNLDEAYVCDVNKMPFGDNSFDLAYADFAAEHFEKPDVAAAEIYRILKPGGVFVTRTPNLMHYIVAASFFTPHSIHKAMRKLMQNSDEKDIFKTYYRCNTRSKIAAVFTRAGFDVERIDMVEKEPSYLLKWAVPFLIGLCYERVVNKFEMLSLFRANIFAVFRKPNSLKV